MEKEIRTCFGLYLNYIKQHIKNLKEYEVDIMDTSDIECQLNIVHMQYILTSSYSVSKTSPALMAYCHLKEMIRNTKTSKVCCLCQKPEKVLDLPSTVLLDGNSEMDLTKPTGWFFN